MIAVGVAGIAKALAWIGSIRQRRAQQRPVLEEIAKDFYGIEKRWLDSQGRGTWKPLNAHYHDWKEKRFKGKFVLRRSDSLYRAFTGENQQVTTRINGNKLQIIAPPSLAYWKAHQLGVKNKLPARPVLDPKLFAEQITKQTWGRRILNYIVYGRKK